jgi:hypothetical protein
VESTEKHRKEVPIWRLCFMVSQRRKDTSRQLQEKMVWSIQGTILFINNIVLIFMLTILNQI